MAVLPASPSDARADRIPALLTRFVQELADDEALTGPPLFELLAGTTRALVGASGACVLEIVDHGVRVAAPTGDSPWYDGDIIPLESAPALLREVVDHRRARYGNVVASDLHRDLHRDLLPDVRQLAVAPMLLAGEVVGLLACLTTAGGAFSDADLALLELVAAHGAMVMRSRARRQQAQAAASDARAEDAARAMLVNAVLVKTARSLANATTPDALYRGMADILAQELRADGFAVYAADPQLRTARVEHHLVGPDRADCLTAACHLVGPDRSAGVRARWRGVA